MTALSGTVQFVERNCPRRRASVARSAALVVTASFGFWRWLLVSRFFVRRPQETIYELMADVADSRHGFTAANLERMLRDADLFDIAELLLELETTAQS